MDETTSVKLVEALTAVWSAIRRRHPGVPPVVVLAAPADRGHGNVLGHFAPLRWSAKKRGGKPMHEVVVVAEHLNRTAAEVVETLLHEASHAYCEEKRVCHCSASQYHNRNFRDAAIELGLDVAQVQNYGYAYTTLPSETALRYAHEIAALDAVLIHRRSSPRLVLPAGVTSTGGEDEADDRPKSRSRKATCACPFVIRVAQATMDATTIRCETCGEPFRLA